MWRLRNMNEQEKKMLRWNFDGLRFVIDNMITNKEGERHELLDDYDRILIDSEVDKSGITLPEHVKESINAFATEGSVNQGEKCIECGQLIGTKKQCSQCKEFRLSETKRKETNNNGY